ncbi:MAG: hypothetical protein P9L97_04465 [Candidatus Tenebribacter davisii]|nr:hypothetical protein [Candidatus Tenebribacter davisii]
MQKILFLIIAVLIITLLVADEHNGNDLFMTYQQDQNFDNFQKAIEHYNSNNEIPDNNKSALMLSYLYTMELNRNLDILKVNSDSLDNMTKFSYANLLLELGKFNESIHIYDQLNADFPKWSCPWRHKGEAFQNLQDYKSAEFATMKAIESREDHFDAYIQLANIQKELGEYRTALTTLEKGLQYKEADHEDEVSDSEIEALKMELNKLLEKH